MACRPRTSFRGRAVHWQEDEPDHGRNKMIGGRWATRRNYSIGWILHTGAMWRPEVRSLNTPATGCES